MSGPSGSLATLPAPTPVRLRDGVVAVRDLAGPPGAPTVVLLHGWTSTADLNWYRCYGALTEHVRVVAFDHRGHGRGGLRSRRAFRLEDCADDAVAVVDALEIDGPVVPVGYSMGGAVAQLVWHRHPTRIAGLVLGATAMRFGRDGSQLRDFALFGGMAAMARVLPAGAKAWVSERVYLRHKRGEWDPWALEAAESHEWRAIIEAGIALGRFGSAEWLGGVDVPTSVIVTTADDVVPTARQELLAATIPVARIHRVAGDHLAVVSVDSFADTLVEAVLDVVGDREPRG